MAADGNTVLGSFIDFTSIDSSNVLIARNAMFDIIFGNDPSAVSFISTKQALGITLDSTDNSPLHAKNYDLAQVKVYSPNQTVIIDNLIDDNMSAYGALTQTGPEIRFKKYNKE